VAHALLVVLACSSARRSGVARAFLGIHAFGLASFVRAQRGGDPGQGGRIVGHVLYLQATGIGGTLRWARGERPAVWPKPERTIGGNGRADASTQERLADPSAH
jgi:hypothetical protein